MKIAISSTGANPDALVDARFERCPYFIVMDSETVNYKVLANEAALLTGGAGADVARMLANAGIKTVITGNIEPKAIYIFKFAGIKVYLCGSGTVGEVLDQFRKGWLKEISYYSAHFKIGSGGIDFEDGSDMRRGMGGGLG